MGRCQASAALGKFFRLTYAHSVILKHQSRHLFRGEGDNHFSLQMLLAHKEDKNTQMILNRSNENEK